MKTDTTPSKTRKELHQAALQEAIAEVGDGRLELYTKIKELEEIGGQDDYTDGLLKILQQAGEGGVTLAALHCVFGESSKLAEARDALVKDNRITSTKRGATVLLKFIS